MMSGYSDNPLTANAFRIKEMGDGFLCTIGYPFSSTSENIYESTEELAERFISTFCQKLDDFGYSEPIYCGIGIAFGPVESFYPKSPPIEYDLFGHGIVLATRYEGMRKTLLEKE